MTHLSNVSLLGHLDINISTSTLVTETNYIFFCMDNLAEGH